MPKIIKIIKGEKPIRAHNKEEKKPARGYIIEENKPAGASYGQERKPAGAIYGQRKPAGARHGDGPVVRAGYELSWALWGEPSAAERALAQKHWEAEERGDEARYRAREAQEQNECLWRVNQKALLEIDHLRETLWLKEQFIRDLLRDSEIQQAQIDKLRKEAKEAKENILELIDLDN